jgi:spore coat polysaccharide biosynthesis predicted glycosyltransferase SpsG
VCSAGITLLEALALGRPTVAVVASDNQRRYHEGLTALGATVGATTADDAAQLAAGLVGDADARTRLAAAATAAVDGRGAHRVAEAVVALL